MKVDGTQLLPDKGKITILLPSMAKGDVISRVLAISSYCIAFCPASGCRNGRSKFTRYSRRAIGRSWGCPIDAVYYRERQQTAIIVSLNDHPSEYGHSTALQSHHPIRGTMQRTQCRFTCIDSGILRATSKPLGCQRRFIHLRSHSIRRRMSDRAFT